MTILAFLLERTVMRIGVARGARREIHVFETRRAARRVRFVARLAFNLHVKAGKRITRLRMIELLGSFPVLHIMATLAIFSELALMDIFVARNALLRETDIPLRQILALQ